MCTVLYMRTDDDFVGNNLNLYQQRQIRLCLLYRGRDNYNVSIYNYGQDKFLFYTLDNDSEVIDIIKKQRGKSVISIFGRATPETEQLNVINKQPFVRSIDGEQHILMHHGIYSNAKEDEHDSEVLLNLLTKDKMSFENELRYNSSFLVIDGCPKQEKLTVYKGQFPWGIINQSSYSIIGTIPFKNDVITVPTYTKTHIMFKDDVPHIVASLPVSGSDDSIASIIPYDQLLTVLGSTIRVGVLYSGGMDCFISTEMLITLLKQLGSHVDELHLFNINYGQYAADIEKSYTYKAATYFESKYSIKVIPTEFEFKYPTAQLSNLTSDSMERANAHMESESDSNYVPMRNLQLISFISPICEQLGITILCIGLNLTEGMTYCDNSPEFMYNMNSVLNVAGKRGYRLQLVAPMLNMTKTEAVLWSLKNNVNLEVSFSCYYPKPNGEPCNECGSCLLRNKSIERAKGLINV